MYVWVLCVFCENGCCEYVWEGVGGFVCVGDLCVCVVFRVDSRGKGR